MALPLLIPAARTGLGLLGRTPVGRSLVQRGSLMGTNFLNNMRRAQNASRGGAGGLGGGGGGGRPFGFADDIVDVNPITGNRFTNFLRNNRNKLLLGGGLTTAASLIDFDDPQADTMSQERVLPGPDVPPFEKANSLRPDVSGTKKDETTDEDDPKNPFLDELQALLSDRSRLGDIAQGVSLLEGRGIEESADLRDLIVGGAGAGGKVNIEIVDAQGNFITAGNSDSPTIKQLLALNPSYRAAPIGTSTGISSKQKEIILESNVDFARKQLEGDTDQAKTFFELEEVREQLINKLSELDGEAELDTGIFAPLRTQIEAIIGEEIGVSDAEILSAFNTVSTLELTKKLKGAISEKEIDLLSSSQPSLGLTNATNLMLLNRQKTLQKVLEARVEYIESTLLDENYTRGYNEVLNEFNEKYRNNIVDDESPDGFKARVLGATIVDDFEAFAKIKNKSGNYFINDTDAIMNGVSQYGNYFEF